MSYQVLKPLAVTLAVLGLASCATVPRELAGHYAAITPQQASAGAVAGTQVRWGGKIIETDPGRGETCIYVLGKPLNSSDARPRISADSIGRFVACHPGFYDPEVYAKGRELTVTGTLQGTVVRRVGQYDYPYPRVVADAIHLWPVRVAYRGYYGYNSSFYSPFWGPGYSPWWGDGFYGGGFYGGDFYGDYDGGDDDD